MVGAAEFVQDDIAVAVNTEPVSDAPIVAAQAADELLGIEGVEASFVITQEGGTVLISGRSWGGYNVQVILEKLGGGGHMTVAGAQFYDSSVQEVKERLLSAIDEYMSERE